MNQLLPIVRRVRRPLVVGESVPDGPAKPPVVAGNVELVKSSAEQEVALGAKGRPYLTPALSLPLARAGEGEHGKGESKPAETQSE